MPQDTHAPLKERHRAERDGQPQPLALRLHRSLSWLARAEAGMADDDPDCAFILYWIAFNAAYAGILEDAEGQYEKQVFRGYFDALLGA